MSARRGEEYVIFPWHAFVQPAFFVAGNRARNGVAIVVAFKNLLFGRGPNRVIKMACFDAKVK